MTADHDRRVTISQSELERIVRESASEGARSALHELGLDDKHAAADVRDLRTLLDAFRNVRRGALRRVGELIVTGLLMLLMYLAGRHGIPGINP